MPQLRTGASIHTLRQVHGVVDDCCRSCAMCMRLHSARHNLSNQSNNVHKPHQCMPYESVSAMRCHVRFTPSTERRLWSSRKPNTSSTTCQRDCQPLKGKSPQDAAKPPLAASGQCPSVSHCDIGFNAGLVANQIMARTPVAVVGKGPGPQCPASRGLR